MLKIDYLHNNERFKNDIITYLNNWNNKTFDNEAVTVIALDNHELVGFYQIKAHDNDNTNLSPWLTNVYIVPEKRKNGYSRKLLETIPSVLKDLGYDIIFLHTKLINYYEKFGWEILCPFEKNDGIKRNIYIFKFK
jgi:GNAT superfamily N-acetyltransferase